MQYDWKNYKMVERLHFCVYEHIRPDTGQVFYVGKGKAGRPYIKGRNNIHSRIVDKLSRLDLKVEVRIVKAFLTETVAFALEKELIKKYGRINIGTGILCNLTDGGDWSVTGMKHSEETKVKNGELHRRNQANGGYTKGRKLTEAHKVSLKEAIANREPEVEAKRIELVSQALVGNTHTKGHVLTKEHKVSIGLGVQAFRDRLSPEEKEEYKRKQNGHAVGKRYAAGHTHCKEHKVWLAEQCRKRNKTPKMRECSSSRRGPDGRFGPKKEDRINA